MATADQASFLADLFDRGLLVESGVRGVYGRGPDFERVRVAFDDLVTRAAAADEPEVLRFPPVLPLRQLEAAGFLASFPHLAGTVFAFDGGEREAFELKERAGRHEDWSELQSMTDLALLPAACYPVYPAVAARGQLQPGGITVDPGDAYVFRHEPSDDPARLQAFHMRELVRLGEPEVVRAWFEAWRDRALELLRNLGLEAEVDVGADPFFGRGGRMLAESQREQQLKFEILAPISGAEPTAVASFNHHQDHFGVTFGIELADGAVAHTACLGFGHERIVLALLHRHGLEIPVWPDDVRDELRLA